MNVMRKVTLATLKKNRRRTVITILGTAVAVAMVTAIAVLVASAQKIGRRVVEYETGSWHISFEETDGRALTVLESYGNAEYVDLQLDEGILKLPGREANTRSEMRLVGCNAESWQRLWLQDLQGRLPEKPGEILVSDEFLDEMGWQVGHTAELDFGFNRVAYTLEDGSTVAQESRGRRALFFMDADAAEWVSEGTRSVTVVGAANMGRHEQGWQNSFTALTVLDINAARAAAGNLNVFMGLKDTSVDAFAEGGILSEQIAALTGASPAMGYNTSLLALGGVFSSSDVFMALLGFLVILLLIILIGSVSLISNAFTISLAERVRALGMLAGVGATKKQKRGSVFFEAVVIGAFAIPAGILGGLAGIGITLAAVGGMIQDLMGIPLPIEMHVNVFAMVFTVLFSALVLLLSAWMPARRASRVAPVQAMRAGGQSDKLRRTRAYRATRRLFGYEAELGLKNARRSRRRYFAILSSLIISVVLFLSVSAAMLYLRQSAGLVAGDESPYGVTVDLYSYPDEDGVYHPPDALVRQIRATPGAEVAEVLQDLWGTSFLPREAMSEAALAQLDAQGTGRSEFSVSVQMYALDDESFARYCETAGIAPAVMRSRGGIPVIALTPLNVRLANGGMGLIKPTVLGVGSSLPAQMNYRTDYENDGEPADTLDIVAESGVFPRFVTNRFGSAEVMCCLARMSDVQPYIEQAARENGYGQTTLVSIISPDADALYDRLEKLQADDGVQMYVYNREADNRRAAMGMLVLGVFTYGFVILITLVCAANIFNTVSTGIALRAREFAMLRSAGLTPGGFNRMLDCESLSYGVKALLWGVPISMLASLLLYRMLGRGFGFGFSLPWQAYLIAAAGVLALVGCSMLYVRSKVKKLNIAQTLKNENW